MSLTEKMLWAAARDLVLDDESWLFIVRELERDDLDLLLQDADGGAA